MIEVVFFGTSPILGFHVTGHSGSAKRGKDIVCSAVSSAVYMAANTITDVIGKKPVIKESDGDLYLKLASSDAASCNDILKGLRLHLTYLSKQYRQYITVTNSEV